jgi:bifunctional non-homologous end joining protein LigD
VTSSQEVVIEGKRLKLTNLSKVLYPKAGFTKAQVLDYYLRIAPALLPHLRDRPLTLKRYPDGWTGSTSTRRIAPRTARPG